MSTTEKLAIISISESEFGRFWPDEMDRRDVPTEWFKTKDGSLIGGLYYDKADGPSSDIAWCLRLGWKNGSKKFSPDCRDFCGGQSKADAKDLLFRTLALCHKLQKENEEIERGVIGTAYKDPNIADDIDISVSQSRWWRF
jgi:hypothetical protein